MITRIQNRFPHLCLAPCVIVSREQSLEQAHCPATSHLSAKLNTSTPAYHPLLLFVTQGHGRHLKMQNRHPAPTTSPCGFSARNTGVACEVCGHAQWREGRNSCGQQRNTTLVKLNMLKNRLHLAFEMGIGNQLAIGLGERKRNKTKKVKCGKCCSRFRQHNTS